MLLYIRNCLNFSNLIELSIANAKLICLMVQLVLFKNILKSFASIYRRTGLACFKMSCNYVRVFVKYSLVQCQYEGNSKVKPRFCVLRCFFVSKRYQK